jgi:hypothetical protein
MSDRGVHTQISVANVLTENVLGMCFRDLRCCLLELLKHSLWKTFCPLLPLEERAREKEIRVRERERESDTNNK